VLERERRNLPEALKQILILITPGGVLGVALALSSFHRHARRAELMWTWITVASTLTLMIGYCMLVFDARYVLPIAPLLIALGARFLWPANDHSIPALIKFLPAALFIASVIFVGFYSGSPFRKLRGDYQTIVYTISDGLREIPRCDRLVSIGSGPFPEHGVGWEAGIYASYFAQCRIVGFSAKVPPAQKAESAAEDINYLKANSILVFANAESSDTMALLKAVGATSHFSSAKLFQFAGNSQALLLWTNNPPLEFPQLRKALHLAGV
jgi:hypothetical protein